MQMLIVIHNILIIDAAMKLNQYNSANDFYTFESGKIPHAITLFADYNKVLLYMN